MILLVAVGHVPVIAEKIDTGSPFLQRNGNGPGTGLGVPLHVRPLVFGDWDVQERGGTCGRSVIHPPDAAACRLRSFIKTHTNP